MTVLSECSDKHIVYLQTSTPYPQAGWPSESDQQLFLINQADYFSTGQK